MVRTYKSYRRGGRGRARAYSRRKLKRGSIVAARRNNHRLRISRFLPLNGHPPSRVVKLRYSYFVTWNPGAGTLTSTSLHANSIFSPQVSGGHQPRGHDEWALFYNHYVVLGSKVRVTFDNTGSGATIIAGVFLDDDTTLPGTPNAHEIVENNRGSWVTLPGSHQAVKTCTAKFSAKKFFRCDVRDRTDLKALFGANPSEKAYFHMWAQANDGLTDPGSIIVRFIVDYICLLSEPKNLATS